MKNTSPRNSTQTGVQQRSVSRRDDRSLEERVRQRAYELYEERGRDDGHHEEDWAQAEEQVRKHGFYKAA